MIGKYLIVLGIAPNNGLGALYAKVLLPLTRKELQHILADHVLKKTKARNLKD
jgi:hypothetical protein